MYTLWRQSKPSPIADVSISTRIPEALDLNVKSESLGGEVSVVLEWGEVHSLASQLIEWLQRTEVQRLRHVTGPGNELPPLSPGE